MKLRWHKVGNYWWVKVGEAEGVNVQDFAPATQAFVRGVAKTLKQESDIASVPGQSGRSNTPEYPSGTLQSL